MTENILYLVHFTKISMEFLFVFLAIAVIFLFFFRKDIKEKIIPNEERQYTIDDQYNSARREREKEIDSILANMGENGIADLTPKDRNRLQELSKK